ncbi:MAG: hypothetical protein ACREIT_09910 [Tepidisphaeraceae bacterium]
MATIFTEWMHAVLTQRPAFAMLAGVIIGLTGAMYLITRRTNYLMLFLSAVLYTVPMWIKRF